MHLDNFTLRYHVSQAACRESCDFTRQRIAQKKRDVWTVRVSMLTNSKPCNDARPATARSFFFFFRNSGRCTEGSRFSFDILCAAAIAKESYSFTFSC